MVKPEEIDERIEELKWKSLPFFERLIKKREALSKNKFQTKKRLRELRWSVLSSDILLIFFLLFNIGLAFMPNISSGFKGFSFFVLVAFFALKLDLRIRLSYLKEVCFLKHLKKEIVH